MFGILLEIETKLNDIQELNSIDIGLDSVSADDTPFARIVPTESISENVNEDTLQVEIYIGTDIKHELRETYEDHTALIGLVRKTLDLKNIDTGLCRFKRAVFDRDSVENFKVAMLEFSIEELDSGEC